MTVYNKTLKLTKLVLCWSVLHSACLFADPIISYDHITHLGLTQKANMWGLSTTDYQRYRWLMQNTPSGHWYQALDPAEVLALNARNHANMKRYALIQARNMHKRVSRELAFNNLYAKAYKQLYPNEKPIMSPGIHELHSITLQAGDRIWLFVGIHTPLGRFVYNNLIKTVQARPGVMLDIYFVGSGLSSAKIIAWAKQVGIASSLINRKITLNVGNQRFKQMTNGKPTPLPLVGIIHAHHFQPITLSSVI